MFRQGGTNDVKEKLIDVMYENQKLREENITLKELLEKAHEFMKQFVIDGVNLLERFLESVGKVIGKVSERTKNMRSCNEVLTLTYEGGIINYMNQEEQMR